MPEDLARSVEKLERVILEASERNAAEREQIEALLSKFAEMFEQQQADQEEALEKERKDRDRAIGKVKSASHRVFAVFGVIVLLLALLAYGGFRASAASGCRRDNATKRGTRQAITLTLRSIESITDDRGDLVVEDVIRRNGAILDRYQPIVDCPGIIPWT